MKNWFANLPRREQIYLLILSFVLALWLLWQLLLAPLSTMVANMASNNVAAGSLLARVDAKVTQLLALQSQSQQGDGGNLVAAISRSADLAGIPVRRLQPSNRGDVQLRLESVDYDTVAAWLYRIEATERLRVLEATITQAGRSGGVNVSLRIGRQG